VESDRRAGALVTENLERCGVADGRAIIRASSQSAIRRPLPGAPFDLVFLDPPYDEDVLAGLARELAGTLASGGLSVLEHARRRPAPGRAGPLVRVREHHAGDSTLSFYRTEDPT
jgi:16S rRNA (guanine966-N2)-methyltransferase